MTWSNVPGSGPQQHPGARQHSEAERVAWEQGATSLFPPAKIADRVSTVLLLAAGAVLTAIAAVAGVIAVASTTASCGADDGCSPGGTVGGAAIAVGGAFVIGVVTLVFAIRAWIRRRTSWWIAGIGFVLTVAVVTWGTVLVVQALDEQGVGPGRGFDTAQLPVP
ncbi:hypothetical protein DEJ16_15100 [Curtobacterium sp. MCJR17_055]|uniref:DUF6264 family protein n=1 Tax=unclassified Curtobacterium TaxID=257496 RepID=UPI000D9EF925|nr:MULTISPECIES: DUF6264 family protein [unclassified Curtobacterium]PYY32909.1 hypothetical protein DEI87_13565 [Curtobacterium sp. MCBD17_029]PYY52818.1 hypothetical protein DEJ16_15100 [Curtobacterium sp. MCJR17_055]PYY56055.1 hypothetical protein DEJ26_14165 [Curtobacterium sp. MCPF17_015]